MHCQIDRCNKPAIARGYCTSHYRRWKRHGSPLLGAAFRGEIPAFLEEAKHYRGRDCLLWPFSKTGAGYGNFAPYRQSQTVHSFICAAVHGDRPSPAHEAAHSCGIKLCCNPTHLRWATRRENAADMISHGASPYGERNGSSKLTSMQVDAIRAQSHRSQRELAREFGVSRVTISMILSGKRWVRPLAASTCSWATFKCIEGH
jgi:DNA-binding XRE family transcriptional regulator